MKANGAACKSDRECLRKQKRAGLLVRKQPWVLAKATVGASESESELICRRKRPCGCLRKRKRLAKASWAACENDRGCLREKAKASWTACESESESKLGCLRKRATLPAKATARMHAEATVNACESDRECL